MRTSSRWLLAVVAAVTLSACAAPAPPPMPMQGTPEDDTAVRALVDRYVAAFNANDAAAMAAMVSEDYETVGPDGTHITGRAAYQQMCEAGVADRQAAGMTLTLAGTTSYVKWIDANHAVVGGTFTVSGVPAGAPTSGSWMAVAMKGGAGDWQLMSSLAADLMPMPGGGD